MYNEDHARRDRQVLNCRMLGHGFQGNSLSINRGKPT